MEIKLKKLTKRQRFAPLAKYEDWQRSIWFLLGATTMLILMGVVMYQI